MMFIMMSGSKKESFGFTIFGPLMITVLFLNISAVMGRKWQTMRTPVDLYAEATNNGAFQIQLCSSDTKSEVRTALFQCMDQLLSKRAKTVWEHCRQEAIPYARDSDEIIEALCFSKRVQNVLTDCVQNSYSEMEEEENLSEETIGLHIVQECVMDAVARSRRRSRPQ